MAANVVNKLNNRYLVAGAVVIVLLGFARRFVR